MTRVKICGVSDPADARRVAELDAWALGMIFWPSSPRLCSTDAAEAIGAEVGSILERRIAESPPAAVAALPPNEGIASSDRDAVTGLLTPDSGRAAIRHQAARALGRPQPLRLVDGAERAFLGASAAIAQRPQVLPRQAVRMPVGEVGQGAQPGGVVVHGSPDLIGSRPRNL